MFKPQYSINSRLLANIKRIAVLIDQLNQANLPYAVLQDLEAQAEAITTHSSTSIEGNPLPLTEVKKILKNKPEHIRDTEQEVLNYNQALSYLKKQTNKTLNQKFILEIQAMVMKGLLPKAKLGKLRKEPVLVNNPKTDQTIYWPPDHQDLSMLIKELIDWTKKNLSELDPIILAGIFHKQFVIIHPFIDGNGRMTRLITQHLLANMGLNTFGIFSFENYYNRNLSKYFQKVGVLANYYDLVDEIDFTEWLEYFSDGIIDELIRVADIVKQQRIGPDQELQKHHKKLLNYIDKHGYITDKLYSSLTDRAKATRSLDFKKLIELGIIRRCAQGKNTYYQRVDDA